MAASITLNGATVALRDFSIFDEREFLTRNRKNLVDKPKSHFPGIYDPSNHEPSQVVKQGKVLAKIHFAPAKSPRFEQETKGLDGFISNRLLDHTSKVVSAATKALEVFESSDE